MSTTTRILLKQSGVPSRAPTPEDLLYGELALNYADGVLFYKTAADEVGRLTGLQGIAVTHNGVELSSTVDTVSVLGGDVTSVSATEVEVRLPTIRRYDFTASLLWVIEHNMGTTTFIPYIVDAANQQIFAGVQAVDANTIHVTLTEATAGSVIVQFM